MIDENEFIVGFGRRGRESGRGGEQRGRGTGAGDGGAARESAGWFNGAGNGRRGEVGCVWKARGTILR